MARRQLLTDGERQALLGIPPDADSLARLFTLSRLDRNLVAERRGNANRLGCAVQLALLRHPGTALAYLDQPTDTLNEPVRGRPFTLRQLLQHRAGLRCYGTLRAYHAAVAEGEHPWSVEDMLRRVDAEALAYEPGHGWGYSNVGYLLVRNLIENEAGVPLGPALERLVFRPLGISGVTVAREPADLDATAWGNTPRYHPAWVYHGLLVGTASAAALVLHRLLAGDLLAPDLLAVMLDGHSVGGSSPGRPWRTASYGLGLMIGQGEPPGEYIGHSGGGPGSTSAIYQRAGGIMNAGARCTAAAFAPVDGPGMVETRAMELAAHGSANEVCERPDLAV